jgi:hypothetical protein
MQARFSGGAHLNAPASFQVLQQTGKAKCIEDAPSRHATFARHFHTPVCQVDFVGRMSVWIDTHHASELQGSTMPAPIEIQPPGICIDFNGNPVFGTSGKDRLDIHLITRPAQQLPPSHVAEDSGKRILHCANDAPRLSLAVELKAPMDARDHEIEARQQFVRIVERSVGQDVGFDSFQDAEALAVNGSSFSARFGAALRTAAASPSRKYRRTVLRDHPVTSAVSIGSSISEEPPWRLGQIRVADWVSSHCR